MIKSPFSRSIAVIAMALAASAANAGVVNYATGTTNPWYTTSNDRAMDKAFGASNWNKSNGFSVDVFTNADFVYLDGSDGAFSEFASFLTANRQLISDYVTNGGRLILNAAPQPQNGKGFDLGFGVTLTYPDYAYNVYLTEAGIYGGLGQNGVPDNLRGSPFSFASVSGNGLTALINGHAGGEQAGYELADNGGIMFGTKQVGKGYVGFGGMVVTDFSTLPAFDLRSNLLSHVATAEVAWNDVPEPASIMLMGLGLAGVMAVRRKKASN